MRGIANERDLAPLSTEGGFSRRSHARRMQGVPTTLGRGASSARGSEPERSRTGAARRALDGVGGLGWSVIGFLVGAVFWHFVGFWSFVSEVVLAGDPAAQGGDVSKPVVPLDWPVSISGADEVPRFVTACTSLALDRATGLTFAGQCVDGLAPHVRPTAKLREDRATVANADDAAWGALNTPARAAGRP